MATTTSIAGHQEVIEEILLRSTVKALVRFKSLSRSYKSLISSTQFTKSHFKIQQASQNHADHEQMILISTSSSESESESDLNFLASSSLVGRHDKSALSRLDFPPKWYPRHGVRSRIMGSCNGLVAVSLNKTKEFFLWNPSTGEFKKLPDPNSDLIPNTYVEVFYGFGYDSSSDDYKVVVGTSGWVDSEKTAAVYSLRRNSWKMINPLPYFWIQGTGNFVDGALHWMSTNSIWVFDLEMEKFDKFQTPRNYKYITTLAYLGRRLCLSLPQPPIYCTELWVLKKFDDLQPLLDFPNGQFPLFTSQGNAIMFENGKGLNQLVRYESFSSSESKLEEFEISMFPNSLHINEAILHCQSLVSPNMIPNEIAEARLRMRKRKIICLG